MPIKRGDKWVARPSINGKKKWGGTFATKKAAREEEDRMRRKASRRGRAARNETCDSFALRWHEDYAREAISTQRNQRYAVKQFAEDFKGVPLDDLERTIARAWAIGQPRKNVEHLRAMFGDAVNDGLCTANPFANMRLPQSRGRKDLIVLTEAEVYELADLALEIHPGPLGQVVRGMILFAAGTGIRPAELWAVERDHLRLDDAECDIRQTVKADGKIRPLTKNYRIRTVIVPPMAAEGATCFPPRLDVRQLFFTPRARQFTRSQHDRYWAAVRKAWVAKLPADHHLRRRQDIDLEDNLAFYELRHFCATDMLERGATPEDVAVQLGHQDGGRLVRELYGHPDDANARGRLKQLYARKVTPIRAATGSQAAEGSRS